MSDDEVVEWWKEVKSNPDLWLEVFGDDIPYKDPVLMSYVEGKFW